MYRYAVFVLALLAVSIGTVPHVLADAEIRDASSDQQTVLPRHVDVSCSDKDTCPFYGCPLLPRDINYDHRAKAALDVLRGASAAIDDEKEEEGSKSATETASPEDVATALGELRSSGSSNAAALTLMGYKGGRVEDQVNQDRAFVVSPYRVPSVADDDDASPTCIDRSLAEGTRGDSSNYNMHQQILGVFDGHDNLGEQVSEYAVQQVPKLIATKLAKLAQTERNDGGWADDVRIEQTKKVLSDTFVEVDANGLKELGISSGGCTATVVLHLGDMLHVANAGDSMSFVATYVESTGKVEVVYASREDKPTLPDERERVETSGGKVYLPRDPSRESSRVYYIDSAGQFRGGLAMSRSLGDWDLGSKGVIPDPIVDTLSIGDIISSAANACQEGGTDEEGEEGTCSAIQISSDDVRVFAVSATDGVLDYLQPIDIAKEIAGSLFDNDQSENTRSARGGNHLFAAQTALMVSSAQGWHSEFNGDYRDDMAIAAAIVK